MSDHLRTAEKFESFVDECLTAFGDEQAEWAVTALFYAAAHYGRALAASLGHTAVTSHTGFETLYSRLTGDRQGFKQYRKLKDAAERARYDCVTYTQAEVEDLKKDVFRPWRDSIRPKIQLNPRAPS